MGLFSLDMLAIALEFARHNPVYEDVASKFYEHFLYIASAINKTGARMEGLWDSEDRFYYDVLSLPDGTQRAAQMRSMVGLMPLLAVETLEPDVLAALPSFTKRMQWFIDNRPELRDNVACMETEGVGDRRLLSIVGKTRLQEILQTMLDESEFFSPHGLRAISKFHARHPYVLNVQGATIASTTSRRNRRADSSAEIRIGADRYGSRSTILLVEALQKFHHYHGDELLVECPAGSGEHMTLWDVSAELSHR